MRESTALLPEYIFHTISRNDNRTSKLFNGLEIRGFRRNMVHLLFHNNVAIRIYIDGEKKKPITNTTRSNDLREEGKIYRRLTLFTLQVIFGNL